MPTVAFLDVDHTLLFDSPDSLNMTLLNALVDHEITRVYLFTDMTFSQHAIEERNVLMKKLEELGFSVQGAITPGDITWAMMDNEETSRLHDMCFQDRIYTGKLHGPDFESFVLRHMDTLPNLCKAISEYMPLDAQPGVAYSEACLELHANSTVGDSTKMKSIFAKVFADHLSEKFGYKHTKGLLMDLFLHHQPDFVNGIIVFDDNINVISDITNFKPASLLRGNSAETCNRSSTVLSAVPVTSCDLSSEYYKEFITTHLQTCS